MRIINTGSNPVLTTKNKIMEFIVAVVIGSLIGSFIVVTMLKLFNSKPSINYQELINQSKERLKTQKKLGDELDKLLEEK